MTQTKSSGAKRADAPPSSSLGNLRARKIDYYGTEVLSDEDLLTLLLAPASSAKGAREQARQLLGAIRSLGDLSRLRPHVLEERFSLSTSQATALATAIELGDRAHRDRLLPLSQEPLTYERVIQWARPRLAGLEHEEVWVLCVNSHSALRSAWQVGRGGMHGCGLLARDLLTPVVRDGASGFILIHNHPSGDPTPSPEDIDLTRGIQLAGTSLCIPLLDHVIVARHGASSFFELGYLDR